jgi:hypothetical protein
MPPHPETGADPGLADTCIYMEAVAGDNGVHQPWPPSAFWLSPDILLNNAPLAGPGGGAFPAPAYQAAVGANAIGVRVHSDLNCKPSSTDIEVHLYAGNPSLAMIPPPDPSTVEIASGIIDTTVNPLNPAGFVLQLSDWTPSTNAANPDGPGHKCLIARAFPDNESPDSSNFHLPLDAHVVQHNICIQPCSQNAPPPGQGGAGGPDPKKELGPNPNTGMWDFPFHTVNPDPRNRAVVTVRAQPVLKPNRRMVDAAVPALRASRAFKRPAPYPPRRFRLSVAELRDVKPTDRSRSILGSLARVLPFPFPFPFPVPAPRYDIQFPLGPHQRAIVTVHADLRGTKVGDAHFINVAHSQNNRGIGGATLVLVRTH